MLASDLRLPIMWSIAAVLAGGPRSQQQLVRCVAAFAPNRRHVPASAAAHNNAVTRNGRFTSSTHAIGIIIPAQRSLFIQARKKYKSKEEFLRDNHGSIMMAVDDDNTSGGEDGDDDQQRTVESEWDVSGLKAEVTRNQNRAIKKIGKASKRLEDAKKTVEELMSDPNASMEALEACPNVDALQAELDELRDRMKKLNELEKQLKGIKAKKGKRKVLPEDVAAIALDLGVNDEPPKRAPRGPKKKKGPRASEVTPRRPYRRYYTENKIEIRVGKRSDDNDALSLLPEHRDGADWWMHASGCPGSHVVIRTHDQDPDANVLQDAAALAARQSKCSGSVIKVSLCRCRDVTKPRGAKPGLVQLNGPVRTISVNMKEAEKRLQRLDTTELLN